MASDVEQPDVGRKASLIMHLMFGPSLRIARKSEPLAIRAEGTIGSVRDWQFCGQTAGCRDRVQLTQVRLLPKIARSKKRVGHEEQPSVRGPIAEIRGAGIICDPSSRTTPDRNCVYAVVVTCECDRNPVWTEPWETLWAGFFRERCSFSSFARYEPKFAVKQEYYLRRADVRVFRNAPLLGFVPVSFVQ